MATMILLRHGQSVWNAANKFTGWTDVELSEVGEAEAAKAGEDLAEIEIDVVESFQYRMYEYKRRFSESKKASRGDTDKGAFLRAELENKLSLEITEMYRDALFLGADRDLLQEKLKKLKHCVG